jgi:hypothetical protein
MDLLRDKISCCERKHSSCPAKGSPNVPTRVLDVSPEEKPGGPKLRLHEFEPGANAAWATLSYVWGGAQSFMTVDSNIEQYREGIDEQTLGQTIRDAITVTRELGLRYLWVDSLCIIQDSDADKAKEIYNMQHNYQSAFITIAAVSSESAYQGFLNTKDLPVPKTFELPLLIASSASKGWKKGIGKIYLTPSVPEELQPINTRAWCMVERVLSPRYLVFDRKQRVVQFHCQHGQWLNGGMNTVTRPLQSYLQRQTARKERGEVLTDSEETDSKDYDGTFEDDSASSSYFDEERQAESSKRAWMKGKLGKLSMRFGSGQKGWDGKGSRSDSDSDESREESQGSKSPTYEDKYSPTRHWSPEYLERYWYDIVREYAARSLTDSRDKLAALSGIAMAYQNISESQYAAGNWEDHFPRFLLWRVAGNQHPNPAVRLGEQHGAALLYDMSNQDEHSIGRRPTLPPWLPTAGRTYYRAPSWSWASVDGPINYLFETDLVVKLRRPEDGDSALSRDDEGLLPKFVSVQTNPEHEFNCFTQVDGGELVLEGIMVPLPSTLEWFSFEAKRERICSKGKQIQKKAESSKDKEPVPEPRQKSSRLSRLKSHLKDVTWRVPGTAESRLSSVIYENLGEESRTTTFRYEQGYPPIGFLDVPEEKPSPDVRVMGLLIDLPTKIVETVGLLLVPDKKDPSRWKRIGHFEDIPKSRFETKKPKKIVIV